MGWIYGRLATGQPFKKWIDEGDEKPHTLADVTFIKREEPMQIEKSVADEVNVVMKTFVDNGVPLDQAATIAHRAEVLTKAHLKEENPVDVARNEKLAWIDTERKRLEKLGGRTTTEAINEAMANWWAQHNSPGPR
jgi:uncharacterized protein related to proFAR isomerase